MDTATLNIEAAAKYNSRGASLNLSQHFPFSIAVTVIVSHRRETVVIIIIVVITIIIV